MKVRDRMTFNPYTTSPDQSVGDLWRFMKEHNLNRLPVVDRGSSPELISEPGPISI